MQAVLRLDLKTAVNLVHVRALKVVLVAFVILHATIWQVKIAAVMLVQHVLKVRQNTTDV